MNNIIHWLAAAFEELPLPLLEVWGRLAYIVGLVLAIAAFGGFTFRPGGRWGFGRERQAWDSKAVLSIPFTFILIIVTGYLGSFIVLVPEAQTLESLKDLVVFLCVVLFGYPALVAVPFAYGLSDLIEGVPPDFLLDWLPGYFINPSCFWIAYQLFGKNPDFRRARTWGMYLAFVVLFMAIEPVLWGYICAGKFTSAISYRSITPALFFTTGITWIMAPLAMLVAYPLTRKTGLFWAEIPRHVKERRLGSREWLWEARGGRTRPQVFAMTEGWPIRVVILAPFIALVLLMVGGTAYVTLRSAEVDATKLATRLHQEISENIKLRLDEHLGRAPDNVVNSADIADLLKRLPVSQNGLALIIDRSGRTIASSVADGHAIALRAVEGFREMSASPAQLEEGIQFRFDYVVAKPLSRETWLTRATGYQDRRGEHADWTVLTVLPESYYLAGLHTGNSRSAVIFALALLLSLAVAAVLAATMTGRLRRISLATQALTQGDLSQRVPGSRLEELGTLAESFNSMAEQLQKSFDKLLLEVEIRKRRELDLEASEALLRTSEARYRKLFECAPDGIVIADRESRYLDANASICRMLGYAREELTELHASDIVAPDEVPHIEPALNVIMTTSDYYREWSFRRKDGSTFDAEVTATIMPDGNLMGMIRDITDRKQTEAERQKRHRAEAADRVKSAFLATMSHELRTPLNSIIGFTGILLLGLAGPLNAEQSKQLEMVRTSARHLLALVNDVLDISKIEAGQLKISRVSFNLHRSINKVVSLVTPLAGSKGLELRVRLAPDLNEATSDELRFEQILFNLLSNAIKFTESGQITLGAELVVDFRLPGAESGMPAIHLRVSDTGVGIKKEDLADLFQPFRQIDSGLSRQHDGTGLGLAICARLAALMGGEIHAESEWGNGSTFSVTLPLKGPGQP